MANLEKLLYNYINVNIFIGRLWNRELEPWYNGKDAGCPLCQINYMYYLHQGDKGKHKLYHSLTHSLTQTS